jgi:hypothetical protein
VVGSAGTVSVGGAGTVGDSIRIEFAVATSSNVPGVQAAKIARLINKKRLINFREFTAYSPGHYRFLCKMGIAYDFAQSIAVNVDSLYRTINLSLPYGKQTPAGQ